MPLSLVALILMVVAAIFKLTGTHVDAIDWLLIIGVALVALDRGWAWYGTYRTTHRVVP